LRTPALIRKYPLTGGAEALTGRQTGPTETGRNARRITNRDEDKAGGAESKRRLGRVFVSRSLKSLVTEEICGRFGSFDGSILHIDFLELRLDYGRSASLFERFLVFL